MKKSNKCSKSSVRYVTKDDRSGGGGNEGSDPIDGGDLGKITEGTRPSRR